MLVCVLIEAKSVRWPLLAVTYLLYKCSLCLQDYECKWWLSGARLFLLQVSSVRGARSLLMWGWGLFGPGWANGWVVAGGPCHLKENCALGRGGEVVISKEASRFPNHNISFLQCSCYLLSLQNSPNNSCIHSCGIMKDANAATTLLEK